MAETTTFDSTKRSLKDILEEIKLGKTQLPDFQRGWVWDDDRIRSLLSSVSMSFPIGAIMTLDNGGSEINFMPRIVEGAPAAGQEPETLLLDGQQRLTSLFQCLFGNSAVETKDAKGKKIRRWYYIDMEAALSPDADREDAILSIPEDLVVKKFGGEVTRDLTGEGAEFEQMLFPARSVFNASAWRRPFNKFWGHDGDKADLFDKFEASVLERFKQYQIPVIRLTKETPKEAVCLVFEKVNTGGVSLTVFELVTATFAADNFQLREDWRGRQKHLASNYPVLRGIESDDLLQVVTLLVTQTRRQAAIDGGTPVEKAPGISCKRRDILKLTVEDYKAWADTAMDGFERAARFLHRQKIFNDRDVPYRKQLVPLAAIFALLGSEGDAEGSSKKIARWFWCGVLGELYGGAIESRFARDLPEVVAMVRGGTAEPVTITDANFAPVRLLSLRTRNSAAYKGIYALLMRDGCRDFHSGESIEAQTFFDDRVDIHHIFPSKWCENNAYAKEDFNSVINKTALSARTNRSIGGNAPSQYATKLQNTADLSAADMDGILESHLIDPETLRSDDFDTFFERRADALLDRIEGAMGKPIARDPEIFKNEEPEDEYEEEPEEYMDFVEALEG